MKNTIKKTFETLLISATLVACGSNNDCLGKEVIKLDSQLDTLAALKTGTIDVSIIDSVMAGYYTSKGDFKDELVIVPNLILTTEQYGIAGRKADAAFMDKINEGLIGTVANGDFGKIATYFGVTDSVAITKDTKLEAKGTDKSWENVINSGKIIVGYTVFAPIAYTDSNDKYGEDNFTGFDTELARAVVNYLNTTYELKLTLEFQEIDWDTKETLLSSGSIDLIWNGLTITDDRKNEMSISIPYLNNSQVAVVKKADVDKYKTKDDFKSAIIGVEGGSAGEDVALCK